MGFSNDRPGLQNQLPFSIDFPEDPNEFVQEFNDTYQGIVSAVNSKIGGLYVPEEKVTSAQYFDMANPQRFRNVYRMTIDFGPLPNSGAKSVPHNIPNITSQFRLVQCYGGATDPIKLSTIPPPDDGMIPLPNEGILIEINTKNVKVTTTSNLSGYTESTINIEYTKG